MRAFPLLGTVAFMVMLAGNGVAREASRGASFPWLSPDPEQAMMLANSFAFQMQLFLGFAGAEGSLSAVRILAMFAAMVGALLIIFFPKYQKIPVVGTWLLLVIISLFVPVGSGLLFQPLMADKVAMMSFRGRAAPMQDGITSCSVKPEGCGFAPQLLAVHMGSVLQAIANDIFRSKAWSGLIEQQAAATELYTYSKAFNLGSGWVGLNRRYKEAKCDVDYIDIMKNLNGSGSQQALKANDIVPITFGQAFAGYADFFEDKNANYSSIPYMITLPTTSAEVEKLGWDKVDGMVGRYEAGIQALYRNATGNVDSKVELGSTTGSAVISVADALNELKSESNGFFGLGGSAYSDLSQNIGFVANRLGYENSLSSPRPSSGIGAYMYPMTGENLPADVIATRTCFINEVAETSWTNGQEKVTKCMVNTGSSALGVATSYNLMRDKFIRTGEVPKYDLGTGWSKLIPLMVADSADGNALRTMPVAIVDFERVKGSGYPAPKPTAAKPGLSCIGLGTQIVDQAITALEQKQDPSTTFDNLVALLRKDPGSLNGAPFDKVPSERTFEVADMTTLTTMLDADVDRAKLVRMMAERMNGATLSVNLDKMQDAGISSGAAKQAAMADSLVQLMMRVSSQENGFNYGLGTDAAEAGSSMNPDLIGNQFLTEIGGGLAINIGKILAKIGAFFTGPVAFAYLGFLNVLINFTLMVMITITPLLFVFGLLIPSAAAGVMTIAVMSVLILKFVPVTLIILNGVGGMVYDLLPASVGTNAGFTRDLLVLAMGGLYTNIVGLTFFLMFKLGDPAAFLGRLTALDGSAKQLADRGMAVVKTAAVAAASMAGMAAVGGLAGLAGANRTKAAADKALKDQALGMVPAAARPVFNAAKDGVAETQNNADTANKTATDSLANVSTGGIPTHDSAGNAYTPEQMKALSENEGLLAEGLREGSGLTPDEAARVAMGETVVKDVHGTRTMFSAGANGSIHSEIDSTKGSISRTGSDIKGISEDRSGATTAIGSSVSSTGGAGTPAAVTVMGGKLDDVGTVGAISSAATSSVQERMDARKADEQAQDLLNKEKQVQALANKVPNAGAALDNNLDMYKNGEIGEEQYKRNLDNILQKNGSSLASMDKMFNMNQQIGDKLADIERSETYQDIESRLEGVDRTDKAAVAKALGNDSNLIAFKDRYDELKATDTAALTQGELAQRLGSMDNLHKALQLRGAADATPGYGASFLSGVYGVVAGSGGGLAKLPVIGPMVSEAVNEFYEAPERARAWRASGGKSNWSEARGNAQRAGFYNKALAHVPAAEQYANMSANGGFQAQKDLAVQAAREAVERTRSQWGAQLASKKDNMMLEITRNEARSSVLSDDKFTEQIKGLTGNAREVAINDKVNLAIQNGFEVSAERASAAFAEQVSRVGFDSAMNVSELRGLGRIDAADRLVSVRQEAKLMQGESLLVKVAEAGLDGNMLLKEENGVLQAKTKEVGVALTPDMLNKFRGDLATKKHANGFDEMMIAHYGLAEKQYLRGDSEWNSTRNMNTSATAAAAFARKDVSTDYLIGGHLKMVQGKERFMESKGQYETLVKFRNESNTKFASELASVFQKGGQVLADALKDAKVGMNVSSISQLSVDDRAKMEKWANTQLKARNELVPLNAIFDEASSSGASKYELKAQMARYNIASEQAEVWNKTQKAAAAAIMASVPDVKNIGKKVAMEVGGVKFDMGTGPEKIFEKTATVIGDAAAEFIQSLTKSAKTHQHDAFDIMLEKGKGGHIRVDASDFMSGVNSLNPQNRDKMMKALQDGNDGKGTAFRMVTGSNGKKYVEFASLQVTGGGGRNGRVTEWG